MMRLSDFLGTVEFKGRMTDADSLIATLDGGAADIKAILDSTTSPVESFRTGRVVSSVEVPLGATNILPSAPVSGPLAEWMEETIFADTATETDEGAYYPESTFVLAQRSVPTRKIGASVPATDEQLEDVPGARAYLDDRLTMSVRRRLDWQLINGTGVGNTVLGFLNWAGIAAAPIGADTRADAISRAAEAVGTVGAAVPDYVLLNPADAGTIFRNKTTDGIYIGVPVNWPTPLVTPAMPAGTALIGAFAEYAAIGLRRGIDVQVTNSHGTDFLEGRQRIRADVRAALIVYRPAAFIAVTGL